jgi:hypothetical protein
MRALQLSSPLYNILPLLLVANLLAAPFASSSSSDSSSSVPYHCFLQPESQKLVAAVALKVSLQVPEGPAAEEALQRWWSTSPVQESEVSPLNPGQDERKNAIRAAPNGEGVIMGTIGCQSDGDDMTFDSVREFASKMSAVAPAETDDDRKPPILLVVVPGFGPPHLALKLSILERNMPRIRAGRPAGSVFFRIFCYADLESSLDSDLTLDSSERSRLLSLVSDLRSDLSVTLETRLGIIWAFLKSGVPPSLLLSSGFTEVLIILDDVELTADVPWGIIKEVKRVVGADVVSPSMHPAKEPLSRWPWMAMEVKDGEEIGRMQTSLEMFCYFMTAETYSRYYEFIDDRNPWSWGADLMLHNVLGFRPLILNVWTMNHRIRTDYVDYDGGVSSYRLAMYQMDDYVRKLVPGLQTEEEIEDFLFKCQMFTKIASVRAVGSYSSQS